MKNRFSPLLLIACFLYLCTSAQSGTWVWVSGTNSLNDWGSFGTQGVASVNNYPPALYNPGMWTDKQGNYWIFGGMDSASNFYNDLWEYNSGLNTWTWVNGPGVSGSAGSYGTQGVPSANNLPPARRWGAATWTDNAGDLWMFGGFRVGGAFNDLWRYHIASNEWTWMGGKNYEDDPGYYGTLYQASDSSLPPARYELNTTWVDKNGKLWLFGGCNFFGSYNDMWAYDIAAGQWAWMGGSNAHNAPGNYGTRGVESAQNAPDARCSYTHWIEGDYLYMSGGDSYVLYKYHSDMWRFNTNNNYWTWMGGDTGNVATGHYGNYCTTSGGNEPRGRFEQRAVQLNGCQPALIMFGGFIYDTLGNDHVFNDLWTYDLSSNQWDWLSGTDSLDPSGSYGTKGVASATNMPPGVGGDCLWTDSSGQLWMWGGWSLASNSGGIGIANAMWKYIPDTSCVSTGKSAGTINLTTDKTTICPGDTAYVCAPAGLSNYYWNTGNTTACINVTAAGNYYVSATQSGGCQAASNHLAIGAYQTAPVQTNQNGDTLKAFSASAYQWFINDSLINGASDSFYIALRPGSYTLQITDTNGCKENSNPIIISGINNLSAGNNIVIFPNPTSAGWQLIVGSQWIGSMAEIYDATGRCMYKTILANQHMLIEIAGLASGIYELRITAAGKRQAGADSLAVKKLVKL